MNREHAAKQCAMEARQSHEWIAQFCEHLLKRRPEMPVRSAIRRAVEVYPDAAGLHPQEAARMLAAG
jgi:hypothetical protein